MAVDVHHWLVSLSRRACFPGAGRPGLPSGPRPAAAGPPVRLVRGHSAAECAALARSRRTMPAAPLDTARPAAGKVIPGGRALLHRVCARRLDERILTPATASPLERYRLPARIRAGLRAPRHRAVAGTVANG